MLEVFNTTPNQSVARGLVEGVDYKVVLDGNGFGTKIVNLDHSKWCPTEGIIELEAMRISNKHDNNRVIRKTKDRKTGLFWGIPYDISEETKQLKWMSFTLENKKILDLSVPEQRREWLILKNSTLVEGSHNLFGNPYYKVIDKEKKATENVNRRLIRQKAELIVSKLSGKALEEAAVNLGVNLEANKNLAMLTDEVYRKMEENPTEFVAMMESPERPYISIFNRGMAMGVIVYDNLYRTHKYGGLDMGYTKEQAIKYLIDNNGISTAIDNRCNSQEAESIESMRMRLEEDNMPNEYDETLELRKKLAEAEAKLAEAGLVKEIKFEAPFVDKAEPLTDTTNELEALKARAKASGVKGYNMMKEETLLAKIAEAEGK